MINLKFEHVRAFLHVARDRGNKRAANALNLTQPAITARIKNLEMALGTELFDRTEGRRRLSKRGELLLDYADKLEHLVSQIERDVAHAEGIKHFLRIGVAETIAQSWMPRLILELKQLYPKLSIELVVDISSRLLEPLADREIDIAIANGTSPDGRVQRWPLPPVPLHWYTSATDPVEDVLQACTFFGKPVITYPKNTEPYQRMKSSVWSRVGQHIPIFPSSSIPSAIKLVVAGVGVSAFPPRLAEAAIREGRIVAFDPGWSPCPLEFAIHYVNDPASPIVERVAEIARRLAKDEHGLPGVGLGKEN